MPKSLHNVVEKRIICFFIKYFGFSIFGHLFLSIFQKTKTLYEKRMDSLHNEKLWCEYRKNNFHFVTIFFFIFCKKGFRNFLLIDYTNGD